MKHDGWEVLDTRDKGWDTWSYPGFEVVAPRNDLEDHWLDNLSCPCGPYWNPGSRMLVHFAFDGRDLVERVERGQKIR